MRLRLAAAIVVPALLALAACGAPATDSSAGSSIASASSVASPTASAAGTAASSPASAPASSPASSGPATAGPSVPAETAVAKPVDRSRMPTATGSFGDKPTITVPRTPPPDTLQRVILNKGSGPVSKAGDWLQVNYLGQVWGGKVFDNSYDRHAPFTIQVGGPQPMVVPGWDVGLRGVAQGSRVLLSFPPEDGYGPKGNPPDISGSDTLIFVVDVIKVIATDAGGQADAAPQSVPAGLPTVSGALGAEPTIKVPTSLPAPTEARVVVLAKGTGEPAQAGDVLVQYYLTTWDGSHVEKSWPGGSTANGPAGTGPESLPLKQGTTFASLIGVPMGSRVLLLTPADASNGTPPLAWVFDLLMQRDLAPATTSGASSAGSSPAEPTS